MYYNTIIKVYSDPKDITYLRWNDAYVDHLTHVKKQILRMYLPEFQYSMLFTRCEMIHYVSLKSLLMSEANQHVLSVFYFEIK